MLPFSADTHYELLNLLTIWDSVSLLKTSPRLYFDETFWQILIKQHLKDGSLACSDGVDPQSLSFEKTRRVSIKTARIQRNLSLPEPKCRGVTLLSLGEDYRFDRQIEKLLDVIQGEDIMLTYVGGEGDGLFGVRCWDMATGTGSAKEIGGMSFGDDDWALGICHLTGCSFVKSPGDKGQYVFSLVVIDDGYKLLILRVSYADRENVCFEKLAYLPISHGDHVIMDPQALVRSTTSTVTVVFFDDWDNEYFIGYGQVPLDCLDSYKEVELSYAKLDQTGVKNFYFKAIYVHNSCVNVIVRTDLQTDNGEIVGDVRRCKFPASQPLVGVLDMERLPIDQFIGDWPHIFPDTSKGVSMLMDGRCGRALRQPSEGRRSLWTLDPPPGPSTPFQVKETSVYDYVVHYNDDFERILSPVGHRNFLVTTRKENRAFILSLELLDFDPTAERGSAPNRHLLEMPTSIEFGLDKLNHTAFSADRPKCCHMDFVLGKVYLRLTNGQMALLQY